MRNLRVDQKPCVFESWVTMKTEDLKLITQGDLISSVIGKLEGTQYAELGLAGKCR